MAMLKLCAAPGCATRTLGEFCINHEGLPSDQRARRLANLLAVEPTAAPNPDPRLDRSRTSAAR
jgi:hypothetical protein